MPIGLVPVLVISGVIFGVFGLIMLVFSLYALCEEWSRLVHVLKSPELWERVWFAAWMLAFLLLSVSNFRLAYGLSWQQ